MRLCPRYGARNTSCSLSAAQCGLKYADYVVALALRPNGAEYSVLWADHIGVTELTGGEDALGMYGEFVTHLYLGDPSAFDVTQRAAP